MNLFTTNIKLPKEELGMKICYQFTIGAIRNKADIQVNQGVGMHIF